jgi:hypothetical protein
VADQQQHQFTTWLHADVRSVGEAISWAEQHSPGTVDAISMRIMLSISAGRSAMLQGTLSRGEVRRAAV